MAADLAIVIKARDEASRAIGTVRHSLGALSDAANAPTRALGGLVDNLGRLGLAAMGLQAVGSAAVGLGKALGVGLVSEMEQARERMLAFTKSTEETETILGFLREEAAKTPFTLSQLNKATAELIPVAKEAGVPLLDLIHLGEILAAKNPLEGLTGGAIALREAMSGDWTSLAERFNFSRTSIQKLKDEGVPNMQIVSRLLTQQGADMELVARQAQTLEGRWATFNDSIDEVRRAVAEPIFDNLKAGLTNAQKWFDDNKLVIMAWADVIAAAINEVIGNFMQMAGKVAEALGRGDIAGAFHIVVDNVLNLGREMFGAGFTIVTEFAGGILSGIGQLMDAAAQVVSSIAGFFIGSSPPPMGPLSEIDRGGRQLIEEYAKGMGEASLGPIEDIAAKIGGALTPDLKSIAKDVEGQLRIISRAMDDNRAKTATLKVEADRVKDAYALQLKPLRDQLELLQKRTNIERDTQRLNREQASVSLQMARIAAEGDPNKRADLQFQLDILRADQEGVRIKERLAAIAKELKGDNLSHFQEEALRLEREELKIQQELAGLVDVRALAEVTRAQADLAHQTTASGLLERQAEILNEIQALPIVARIEEIEAAQLAVLEPIEAQLKGIERQNALLDLQRTQWQNLKEDISTALKAAEVGAKGKEGKGATGGAGGKLDLTGMAKKAADDAAIAAKAAAQKFVDSFVADVKLKFVAAQPAIAGALLGAVAGGAIGGPVGALIGAVLGAKIGEKLAEQHPDILAKLDGVFLKLESHAKLWAAGSWKTSLEIIGNEMAAEFDRAKPGIEEALKKATGNMEAWFKDAKNYTPTGEAFGYFLAQVWLWPIKTYLELQNNISKAVADAFKGSTAADSIGILEGLRAGLLFAAAIVKGIVNGILDNLPFNVGKAIKSALQGVDFTPEIKVRPQVTVQPDYSGYDQDYGRAHGGPVMAGHPYIVGERGPELFMPGMSGNIVPNHELGGQGGGTTVVVNNYGTLVGGSPRDLARLLRDELIGMQRSGMTVAI